LGAEELRDYEPIVGSDIIDELELIASKLTGIVIQNINSTAVGGGVAEILMRMVPLLQELGIKASWDVIKGGEKFFEVTKKIHNALHGQIVHFTQDEIDLFIETNEMNAENMELRGDILFIHDPQPIGLVNRKKDLGCKWIWRCHIDFSCPDQFIWNFLKDYIEQYDVSIFSAPSFARELAIPQVLISPSIDPLSDKNRELTQDVIDGVLEKFNIDRNRPIVTQISRFDYLKDPVGVVKAFSQVKKYIDCQLVLAGGGASDDPEGMQVLSEVQEEVNNDPDIFLLLLPPASDIEINALQRASTVILQKSLREGFGLTVAEALWKAKPVVASPVGGIAMQIVDGETGFLASEPQECVDRIVRVLEDQDLAHRLGAAGREYVRTRFMSPRNVIDYLKLFRSLA